MEPDSDPLLEQREHQQFCADFLDGVVSGRQFLSHVHRLQARVPSTPDATSPPQAAQHAAPGSSEFTITPDELRNMLMNPPADTAETHPSRPSYLALLAQDAGFADLPISYQRSSEAQLNSIMTKFGQADHNPRILTEAIAAEMKKLAHNQRHISMQRSVIAEYEADVHRIKTRQRQRPFASDINTFPLQWYHVAITARKNMAKGLAISDRALEVQTRVLRNLHAIYWGRLVHSNYCTLANKGIQPDAWDKTVAWLKKHADWLGMTWQEIEQEILIGKVNRLNEMAGLPPYMPAEPSHEAEPQPAQDGPKVSSNEQEEDVKTDRQPVEHS